MNMLKNLTLIEYLIILAIGGIVALLCFNIQAERERFTKCKKLGGHMRVIGVNQSFDPDGNPTSHEVKECQTVEGKWIPLD